MGWGLEYTRVFKKRYIIPALWYCFAEKTIRVLHPIYAVDDRITPFVILALEVVRCCL